MYTTINNVSFDPRLYTVISLMIYCNLNEDMNKYIIFIFHEFNYRELRN